MQDKNMNKDLNQKVGQGGKESWSHKTGDAIERVGKKISDAGAKKLGDAIYKAGDKLEHSQDNKNKNKI